FGLSADAPGEDAIVLAALVVLELQIAEGDAAAVVLPGRQLDGLALLFDANLGADEQQVFLGLAAAPHVAAAQFADAHRLDAHLAWADVGPVVRARGGPIAVAA